MRTVRARSALIIMSALLLAVAAADSEVDCGAMRTKELRKWLAARGLKCEGCAEKADYVTLCEQNKDAPLLPPEEPPADAGKGKDQSIEDLLASMKGMPGMEGIKMFTADDLKNMNPEQMGASMGGRGGRKSRAEWRDELVDFYSRYGLDDKIAGVDAALDKWKGRESRMFDALYKKYDVEIRAKSDAAAKDEV